MRDHVLARARVSRERDRELRDRIGLDALCDLDAVPRAALEVLRCDGVGVEIASAHQVQRASHQPRADHAVALDRSPKTLPREVSESRPQRVVRRRRPLRLKRGQALDRGDDAQLCALEEELSREHRAIELAERERLLRGDPHTRTPWIRDSG